MKSVERTKANKDCCVERPQGTLKRHEDETTQIAQVGAVRRVVSARMPTRWGMFEAIGFERGVSNGSQQVESALAIVLGDLTQDAPLLRLHSQCFTGQVLGCHCAVTAKISWR